MIPALAPIFTGPLEHLGEMLVVDDPRPAVPVEEALSPKLLPKLLSRFAQIYGQDPARNVGRDLRAVASQWSKWYFSRLVTPVLAANLALDWRLPVSGRETSLVLADDGRVVAVRLPHQGGPFDETPGQSRYAELFDDHVRSVVEAVARDSGLSPKVIWNNAGTAVETVLVRGEAQLGADTSQVAALRTLLQSRRHADGRPNPLFEPIRHVDLDGTIQRQRRVCCVRYLIPELAFCKTCPIRPADKAGR
ncbi:siderophore-iron reductase FhuF [Amorphus sp. 3PC139-8]|uniref:siderophore-iron reductase FhuF n=1 Tax=Amorphus sp. 3PC139-8 TaxID=2735676 RepID=UPI00345CDA9E